MKIAVVDDEDCCRYHLIALIKEYPSVTFDIDEYCSGKEFLNADIEKYSMVFLDIEMPEINGIETAVKILERKASVLIFYVTSHNTYISKALRVKTFQFLSKSVDKEDLYIDIDRALIEIKKKLSRIKIEWNGHEDWLIIQDILYIESNNKKIKIVMKNEQIFYFSKKLSDLLEELKIFQFALCHKSFIVNLQQVDSIATDEVILSNHKAIPISKRQRKEFKQSFNLFINEVTL